MIKKYLPIVIMLLTASLFFSSCKSTADMLKAIDNRSYQSDRPLSKAQIPVDKKLVGAYVRKSQPIIVSQLDRYHYQIKFLDMNLSNEDVAMTGHMTQVGKIAYINVAWKYKVERGDEKYIFLKVEYPRPDFARIGLLSNNISGQVPPAKLKNWLLRHGAKDSWDYKMKRPAGYEPFMTDEEKRKLDSLRKKSPYVTKSAVIYQYIGLDRITVEKALAMQKNAHQRKKENMFANCPDIESYQYMTKTYPQDTALFRLAAQSLYNRSVTVGDYESLLKTIKDTEVRQKAQQQITRLRNYERDSVQYFTQVKVANTIEKYRQFMDKSQTSKFKDSAKIQLNGLLDKINPQKIEWHWTSNEKEKALQLLFAKINYQPEKIEAVDKYAQILTQYCLEMNNSSYTQKGLKQLNGLFNLSKSPDTRLDLYMHKVFLLWSLKEYKLLNTIVKSRTSTKYSNGETFYKKLKKRYKSLVKNEVVLPDRKATWKKIRRL